MLILFMFPVCLASCVHTYRSIHVDHQELLCFDSWREPTGPDYRGIDFLLQQHKAYVYLRLQGKTTPKLFPKLLYHHAVEPNCQQLDKWDEIPYIKVFILLHNEVSPGTGNSLMVQRREVASKPCPNSKTKESLNNSLNLKDKRLVAGRPLPQLPARLGWWLITMAMELHQYNAPRTTDCHNSSNQILINHLREIKGIQDPSFLHDCEGQ